MCYSKYMTLRFGNLYVDGVYHVFNRGVDKRQIFMDTADERYFLELLQAVNREESIGNLRDYKNTHDITESDDQLVEIIAYSLQGNHFHLLLRQVADNGVSRFMHRLSTGYTMYFNQKCERAGALFQGKYKYIETKHDAQIVRLICYINRNEDIHDYRGPTSVQTSVQCSRSSFVGSQTPSAWLSLFDDYKRQEREIIHEIKQQRQRQEFQDEQLE